MKFYSKTLQKHKINLTYGRVMKIVPPAIIVILRLLRNRIRIIAYLHILNILIIPRIKKTNVFLNYKYLLLI